MAVLICTDCGLVLSSHYTDYELTGDGKYLSYVFPVNA